MTLFVGGAEVRMILKFRLQTAGKGRICRAMRVWRSLVVGVYRTVSNAVSNVRSQPVMRSAA